MDKIKNMAIAAVLAGSFTIGDVLGYEPGENLLANPAFDQGDFNTNSTWALLGGWVVAGGTNNAFMKPLINEDKENKLTGVRSLRVEMNREKLKGMDGKPCTAFSSKKIEITPGSTYTLSIWAKGDGAQPAFGLCIDGWFDKNPIHWYKSRQFVAETEWKKYSVTATVPGPGQEKYAPERKTVCVRVELPVEGTVWFDNVCFKEEKE